MAHQKRARGRPKGSGIDDQQRLLDIGRIIQRSPGLKPTTAIRKLGFSDPSTIRRLRDKYKASRETVHRELMNLELPSHGNDNLSFQLPTAAARQSSRAAEPCRSMPRGILQNSQLRGTRQNELSCLLAIGAHALAQAAACCVDFDDDGTIDASTDSQAFLAQMLFMISNPRGDEATAS